MSPLPFLGKPVTRAIMSPPTARISPCLCNQSLVSLTYKWRCEKNGEIALRIIFYRDLYSPFYNWSVVISQTCHLGFLNTQTGYSPDADSTPLHGEKPSCLDNFAVHSLTFLQLNCLLWSNVRSMISQTTDWCLPCCHCCLLKFIKTEQGGKKNGEVQSRVLNITFL